HQDTLAPHLDALAVELRGQTASQRRVLGGEKYNAALAHLAIVANVHPAPTAICERSPRPGSKSLRSCSVEELYRGTCLGGSHRLSRAVETVGQRQRPADS